MKVFFSSLKEFFLLVLHERPLNKVPAILLALMMVCLVISIIFYFVLQYKHRMAKEKFHPIPVIGLILTVVTIIVSLVIYLCTSANDVLLSTYAKAESLYDSNHCQDAKKLYWSIYYTDYADCRDKMARCDYISAKYYINNIEYEKAFELLLPHLFNNPTGTSPEILDEMRDLATSTMQGVLQENQSKGMLTDAEWIIGKWVDKDGNYIHSRPKEGFFTVGGNIYDQVAGKEYYYSFKYGIFKLTERDTGETATEIIFFPSSEDKVYAYNISTGKMYFLIRDRDAK